jgi:hypothetical protein
MKPLLLSLLVLALMAGSLLAFSGSTSSTRGDSGVKAADAERTTTATADTANESADRTETRSGKSAETDRTASAGTGTAAGAARRSQDSDSSAVRTVENAGRAPAKTAVMRARAAWNASDAARRCAKEDGEERCLMRMADASLYSQAELKEVNESELRCGNASSLRGRVACRLELPKDEQKEGLYYLPEECRNLSGEERGACLARYDVIQPCRFEKGDEARFACVRKSIGMNTSAREQVDECRRQVRGNESQNEEGRTTSGNDGSNGLGACVSEVRAQVFEEAKFRIYNLEEKAGRLASYGVSNATISEFVTQLEEYKAKFVAANGAAAKKEVLREVAAAWKEFVQKARAEAQRNRAMERAARADGRERDTKPARTGRNASGADEGAGAS